MKATTLTNEEQLIAKALDALVERLGVLDTNRFVSMATKERIESVKRHRMWQKTLDKNRFFDEAFGSK